MNTRNIFIINPASGKRLHAEALIKKLDELSQNPKYNLEYYCTKSVGDAERFVRMTCKENAENTTNGNKTAEAVANGSFTGDSRTQLRFFVCGGDGSVNEVLNGAYGFANAEIGVVPVGTGNDFIRNFASKEKFLDLEKQLCGTAVKTDIIKYTYEPAGEGVARTAYCANMFNIGFDCEVVDITQRMKKLPFVSGHFAYLLGVAVVLAKMLSAELKVKWQNADGGEESYQGNLLLTAIANGAFCGGGVKGVPLADVTDGVMDLSLIKKISRLKLISLFGKYSKGTHLEDKRIEGLIIYRKCPRVWIEPLARELKLCVDGELLKVKKVDFEIMPQVVNFIVPADEEAENERLSA